MTTPRRQGTNFKTRLREAVELADEKERVIVELRAAVDDRLKLIRRLDGELHDLRSCLAAIPLATGINHPSESSDLEACLLGAMAEANAKEHVIGQLKSELDNRLELIERLDADLRQARGKLNAKEDERTALELIAHERAQVIQQLELAVQEGSSRVDQLNAQLEAKCKEASEADFVARVGLGVILGIQLNPDGAAGAHEDH